MSRNMNPAVIRSIRDRLKNIAREESSDFNLVVIRYVLERFIYRLSKSDYADQFVLKGAALFLYWEGSLARPTKDVDFTGVEEMNAEELETIVKELCEKKVKVEDGVVFLVETIESEQIRAGQTYNGFRVNLKAQLGAQKIKVHLDVGFGDVLLPPPEEIDYPVLLDFPAPRLKVCQKETTIAEKTQNMVVMGIGNSRMKDFYDIWFLSKNFEFDLLNLREAIIGTFKRRKTKIPTEVPVALREEFAEDSIIRERWLAFLKNMDIDSEEFSLYDLLDQIRNFILPVINSIIDEEQNNKTWEPEEGWI